MPCVSAAVMEDPVFTAISASIWINIVKGKAYPYSWVRVFIHKSLMSHSFSTNFLQLPLLLISFYLI